MVGGWPPYGDGVGHLQAELEVIRRLADHALQILDAGEGVVGGIDANGFKDLGVFGQAVTLEPGFREPAPVLVAGAVVEQAAPARVFPGGGANVDALGGQGGGLLGQLLQSQVHKASFTRPLVGPQATRTRSLPHMSSS